MVIPSVPIWVKEFQAAQPHPYPNQLQPSPPTRPGPPQFPHRPVPPPRKPIWKQWWVMALAAVWLFFATMFPVAALLSGKTNDGEGASGVSARTGAPPAVATYDPPAAVESVKPHSAEAEDPVEEGPASTASFAGQQDGDVAVYPGESISMDGVTITATALTYGDSVLGPTACSTVTLQNSSGRVASFGSFDWYIQQPSGTVTSSTLHGSDNYLRTGDIIDGGTATGGVCFDADLSTGGQFVLLYEPFSLWGSDRGAWVNDL